MPARRRVPTKIQPRRSSKGGGCCSCLITLLTLLVLGGLAVFLAVYLTGAESPSDLIPEDFHPGDYIPNWEEFFHEDPFNATTPEDANRWRGTRGTGGLELELVNALDADWHPFFEIAVAEWDAGNPDTLTLSVSNGTPDPDCAPIRGKMRVCNGNYGDTRWKGINVVSLINEEIIESSAKMNEYYLARGTDAQKQYTMCHEIGHGFGLPHTDENFNNRNTGECMDYTVTPEANQSPGIDNFLFLQAMYGTVNDRRGLLRRMTSAKNEAESVTVPQDLHLQMIEAVKKLEQRIDGLEHLDGWFEEHRSDFGTLHSQEFGEGYTVKVAKLLVTPDEQ